MINLNHFWIDMQCPKCGYQDAIQLIDAKSEKTIFCHNCKVSIKLTDNEASVHSSIDKINYAFKSLEKTLKNFGK